MGQVSGYRILPNIFAVIFTVCLVSVTTLNAQVDTGSIIGTVTDQSGAIITGAKVTLTNQGTGASLSTVSGTDGVYKFSPVRIGSYKVDATAQGFQTTTQSGMGPQRCLPPLTS